MDPSGSSATSCLRSSRNVSARTSERLPTKSPFDGFTIHPIPRSSGVTVPSVSCPTITYPFSARRTCIASVPYGTAPAATTASQTWRPCHDGDVELVARARRGS